MSKTKEISDDMYSFLINYYSNKTISSEEKAKQKLADILCGIEVADFIKGKLVFKAVKPSTRDSDKENGPTLDIQGKNNNQTSDFINADGTQNRHTPNDTIREVLFEAFRPVEGVSKKVTELSEYFRRDEEFTPSGNTSKFFYIFKNNALEDPDDCDDLNSFINQNEDPYQRAAWMFAFMCFPKNRQIENTVDRNKFFDEVCPELLRSKKECYEVKDITDGSISNYGKVNQSYIGRDRELSEIEELIRSGCHVALYGLGGIGKTYICRKLFWSYKTEYREGIKYVAWIKYNKSLVQSFRDTFKNIKAPNEYGKGSDSFEQYSYEPVIQEMYKDLSIFSKNARDIVAQTVRTAFNKLGRSLLVFIDNANIINNDDINWLNSCSCRIVVTSRHPLDGFSLVHIEGTDIDYCCDLYRKNCGSSKFTAEENDCIRQIVERADRHTLSIELIAKAQHWSHKKVKDMLEQLKATGFSLSGISETFETNGEKNTFIEHLSKVFDITDIQSNESLIKIMRYFSLLEPNTTINLNTVKAWFELDNFDDINTLIKMGWLKEEENNYISIHPVISDVIKYKYPPDYRFSEPIIKTITDYYNNLNGINGFAKYAIHCKSVAGKFSDIKEDSNYSLQIATAMSCSVIGDIETAIKYYDNIIEYAQNEKIEDDAEKGAIEIIKAYKYKMLQQNRKAIECNKSALKLCSALFNDNPQLEARLYEDIGSDYATLSNQKNAIEYYNTALKLYIIISGENSLDAGRCYGAISIFNALLGEHDKASEYMNKAERIFNNDKSDFSQFYLYWYKGLKCYINDDPQNAQQFLDKASTYFSLFDINPTLYAALAPFRADIYVKNGKYDEAIEILDKASETQNTHLISAPIKLINKYITKAEIHFKKGEYNLFVEYYNQSLKVWSDNYYEIDHSSQATRNTIISIISIACNGIDYSISNSNIKDALAWYYSFIDLIDPYIVESRTETAISIYCNFAKLLLLVNDLQNSLIYYKKVIELADRFSLQDNDHILEAKKQVKEIEEHISEA